ncbi:MAG: formate dehydrogenase subunit gamma [Halieaceae bacterium]|jgi:formate dehydrogenase subunit gamma|nr:formate dehydrogenase subunit gamma [Halieaceae bacterium]
MDERITDVVMAAIERHRDVRGGLLPLLHTLQDTLGYIPAGAVPAIARGLQLSRAEVHGVISFYHDFRGAPAGEHLLQICRAEACQAMGSRALEAHAKQRLGIDYGGTTADGSLSLEPVYCLGNCACSPSVRLDGEVYARVDPARLDALLNALGAGGAG